MGIYSTVDARRPEPEEGYRVGPRRAGPPRAVVDFRLSGVVVFCWTARSMIAFLLPPPLPDGLTIPDRSRRHTFCSLNLKNFMFKSIFFKKYNRVYKN